ncbi:unnamed protein product [Moneuplotes crassus]|uniref:Protein kinase domain-containing protein n=1 Tax=Euplotes crassus TaxID=5936 RepID=A0AAD1XKL7_EUPCR|nr:unnamed protein product [Moneuplotes crassus]
MIDNYYKVIKVVGKGGSSKVILATDPEGNKVAIKVIRKDKKYTTTSAKILLDKEVLVLTVFDGHPNVIKCLGTQPHGIISINNKAESIMYNVLEYAENQTLSSYVKKTGPVEELIAKFYATQICSAVAHIHSSGLAHLDIKLENILLDEFFNVKLADFGSCQEAPYPRSKINCGRGTKYYMAPEIESLEKDDSFIARAADIYSLGVTLYLIVTGVPSSLTNNTEENLVFPCDFTTSLNGNEQNTENEPEECILSPEFVDLILAMLDLDPLKRPSIFKVMNHPWIDCKLRPEIAELVYLEMSSRKAYIKEK